ncbi:MAG: efflux RND transporter periplasmic adaptor subunit, partial [Epsilonproteobacteria bacterium]|nr:efflux RND transporter periplasmic adaptor subunit [Campylobacterota bacterium]
MEPTLAKLLQLEHNCRSCETLKELYFQVVNETRNLVSYTQGVLLTTDLRETYRVVAISDIAIMDATSPYVQWIEEIAEDIKCNEKAKEIFSVDTARDLKEINAKSFHEFAPPHLLAIPLHCEKEQKQTRYMLL